MGNRKKELAQSKSVNKPIDGMPLVKVLPEFAKIKDEIERTPLSVIIDTARKLEAERLTILRERAISVAQAKGQADERKLQRRWGRAIRKAIRRERLWSFKEKLTNLWYKLYDLLRRYKND